MCVCSSWNPRTDPMSSSGATPNIMEAPRALSTPGSQPSGGCWILQSLPHIWTHPDFNSTQFSTKTYLNKTKALMFYPLFEKRLYINYVRRIQVYTRFHQSINGVVNITLKIWDHEEDRHMTKEYLQLSHTIYLYQGWIYTYIHVHVHIHTYVHTYTHIYTYICIKYF